MSDDTKLQLVIIYSASENTYSLSEHNQLPDKATALVEDFNPHMKPGYKLMTLDQHKAHKTEDAQNCRACRETVQRSSGLQPLPKFVRRPK